MSVLSDEELSVQAAAGDRVSLEKLLFRHHNRLLRSFEQRIPADLQGTVSAEDILQQTYIDVFRGIGSFQPQEAGSFPRWLTTIAEHRFLDAIKLQRAAKRGAGRTPANALPKDAPSSVVNLLDLLAVSEHTPSRSAARHEAVSAIHVAMATLKDDYREAIRLRYIEGCSVADVAARMERTERAVHMLCYRGLRELKACLGRASAYLSSSG